MKAIIRISVSAYITLFCFIILNIIWGSCGVISYNELSKYKDTLETNIYDLEDINGNLVLDSEKLISRPDDIKIQAREIGWIAENEGLIQVRGYKTNKTGYSMGKLLSSEKGKRTDNRNNMIIALLVGVSIYIFSGFFNGFRLKDK